MTAVSFRFTCNFEGYLPFPSGLRVPMGAESGSHGVAAENQVIT